MVEYCVLHFASETKEREMDYADMLRDGASSTDMREYLTEGEMTAVTIRIPKNLRDSAKKVASLRGTSFSALIRECMIDGLTNRSGL